MKTNQIVLKPGFMVQLVVCLTIEPGVANSNPEQEIS